MKLDRRQFMTLAAAFAGPRIALAEDTSSSTLVRLPYVQRISDSRATILWTTLRSGTGRIQFWPAPDSEIVIADQRVFHPQQTGLPFAFTQYQAELVGLQPNTTYQYLVQVDGETVFQGGQFLTAGTGPFDFVALGDSGMDTPEQRALTTQMVLERPSFLMHLGDLAYYNGAFSELQAGYFDYYRGIMSCIPFFPAPGNHDYMLEEAAAYRAVHAVPQEGVRAQDHGRYYSFNWGNAHFVSLDTNTPLAQAIEGTGKMLEWLDEDLARTRQFWRILFFHHPPYAAGPNQLEQGCIWAREHIVPIAEKHGVQLVFSGHEHSFQRTYPIRSQSVVGPDEGTVYITSGGGGSMLYGVFDSPLVAFGKPAHHYLKVSVTGSRLTVKAVGIDGATIDTLQLAPAPVIQGLGWAPAVTLMPALTAGSIVHVRGRALADDEARPKEGELPTELGGTIVTLNNQPIELLYASSSEIYGRLPVDAAPSSTLRVITANGCAEAAL